MLKFRDAQNQAISLTLEPSPLQEAIWHNLQIHLPLQAGRSQTLLEALCARAEVALPLSECWQELEPWQASLAGLVSTWRQEIPWLESLDLERYGFSLDEYEQVLADMCLLCQAAAQAGASELRMDLNDLGDLDSEI